MYNGNGNFKLLMTVFFGSMFIPLLVFAAGYGSLSQDVKNKEQIYATKVEVEKLRGDIKSIRVILEKSPWYTPDVKREVDRIQRQTDERIRNGYTGSQKESVASQ